MMAGRLVSGAAVLVALTSACSDTKEAEINGNETPARAAEASIFDDIAWIDSGTLLLQGNDPRREWIMIRDSGVAVALEPLQSQAKTQPSPDGSRLLRVGDDSIAILDVRSVISGRASAERTEVPPFPDLGENFEIRNTTYGFWLNDGRVLVVRTNFDAGYEQCYVYAGDGTARLQIANCLRDVPMTGLRTPSRVVPLGGDRYAAYSNDEGTVHISQFRFTPETGVQDGDDALRYERFADISIYRDEASDTLYLASRLPLNRDGGYIAGKPDFPSPGPATLYRRDPVQGFEATGQTIPYRGALRTIQSGDVAWVEPKRSELCTRTPGREPVCHRLPTGIRAE